MCNKKSCAWQFVPPGWFEECDHGVSEFQSLYDSDTVKSSKLKNVRRKLNILLLRRHLYILSRPLGISIIHPHPILWNHINAASSHSSNSLLSGSHPDECQLIYGHVQLVTCTTGVLIFSVFFFFYKNTVVTAILQISHGLCSVSFWIMIAVSRNVAACTVCTIGECGRHPGMASSHVGNGIPMRLSW